MQHVQVFALVIVAVAVTAVCRHRGWPAPLVLVGAAIVVSLLPRRPAVRDRARAPARVRAPAAALLGRAVVLVPRLPGVAELDHAARRRARARQRARRRPPCTGGSTRRRSRCSPRSRWGRWSRRPTRSPRRRRSPARAAPPGDDAALRREPDQRRHLADALQGRASPGVATGAWALGDGVRDLRRSPWSWASAVGLGLGLGRAPRPDAPRRPGRRLGHRAAHAVRRVLGRRGAARLGRARGRDRRPVPRAHLAAGRVRDAALRGAHLVDASTSCWSRSRSR